MSTLSQVVDNYYDAWQSGNFEREWFTEDFTFNGPLAHCNGREQFFQLLDHMIQVADFKKFNFHRRSVFEEQNTGFAFFDFETSRPFNGATRCAEFFTFEDGRIKAIDLVYDARDWERFIPENAQ